MRLSAPLALCLALAAPSMLRATALPEALPAGSPNAPVAEVDLARYAGTWHEIARLPMFFQRKCARDTTATYTAREGGITVTNRCRKADGDMMESVGIARTTETAGGALEVSFLPGWLAWVPGTWGDYWIIDLDPDYRWAVVGGPSRGALWVLSREPSMDAALRDRIKQRAEARGYDLSAWIVAP